MEIEQYKAKLLDMLKRNLTPEQARAEIRHLFNEDNWLFELREFLTKSVNARISYKMKDRYNSERMYFSLREEIEQDVISSTNWYSYFEQVPLEELSKPIENFPSETLMLIIIEGLKAYVDSGEERNVRCLLLHDLYLSMKTYTPYVQEDGFVDFLASRNHRIDLEDARLTGKMCPFCESTDVKSFGANWKCRTCGREFRKHRKKEEENWRVRKKKMRMTTAT
jgi:ribosomal protein L37AE/L43A